MRPVNEDDDESMESVSDEEEIKKQINDIIGEDLNGDNKNDSDSDSDESLKADFTKKTEKTQKKVKGIMGMKFMQQAEEADREKLKKEAKEVIDALNEEVAPSDDDEDDKPTGKKTFEGGEKEYVMKKVTFAN